jgi:transcriptional regulator GlxA family with amidase domain
VFVSPELSASALVRRVMSHIEAHLADDLSTVTLAAVAGVSARHLSRLFRSEVGETPGRYVRHARVRTAAAMLTSSTEAVTVVARRCGFNSSEALRQAFAATYGVSPSRYRETLSPPRAFAS